jgi:tousled-like kinase
MLRVFSFSNVNLKQIHSIFQQEELSLLRGKVAILEEELSKSRQESTEYRQLSDRLAKVWSYSMHTLM